MWYSHIDAASVSTQRDLNNDGINMTSVGRGLTMGLGQVDVADITDSSDLSSLSCMT